MPQWRVARLLRLRSSGAGVWPETVQDQVSKVSPVTASSPSLSNFFCFMRLFWNQTFTCVSLSCRVLATSSRLDRVRYLLKWNSFSSSVNCLVLKQVLGVAFAAWPSLQMLLPASIALRPGPTILNPQVMCILAGKRGPENCRQKDQWGDPQKKHKILLNKIIHAQSRTPDYSKTGEKYI